MKCVNKNCTIDPEYSLHTVTINATGDMACSPFCLNAYKRQSQEAGDVKLIPENETENVLSVYWQMLQGLEGKTDPKVDILDARLVEGAYNVLNRIGFTEHRSRWEK